MKILSLTILALFSISSILGQNKFRVLDNDENRIQFFLVSNDRKTLLKSESGAIKMEILKKHSDKTFTLHFKEDLSYLLYSDDLYYKKGDKNDDPYLEPDGINYVLINPDEDKIFYVRRLTLKLD